MLSGRWSLVAGIVGLFVFAGGAAVMLYPSDGVGGVLLCTGAATMLSAVIVNVTWGEED